MEIRSHDQYGVKMDGFGRITLRNQRFLRKIELLHRRTDQEGVEEGDERIRRSRRARHETQRF